MEALPRRGTIPLSPLALKGFMVFPDMIARERGFESSPSQTSFF